MKFKFVLASTLIALQASAANWDALVAAATEAGITDAASLDVQTLLQRITESDSERSDQIQNLSDQIQNLTAQLADRDQKIKNQRTEIENLKKQLGKKPGATPAQAVAESDPPSTSATNEIGCLTGKESFVDSLDRIASWL